MPFAPNIVFRMRWMVGIALLAIAAIVPATIARSGAELPATGSAPVAAAPLPSLTPALADLAARTPGKRVEVIVQMTAGTKRAAAAPLVRALGGRVTRDLHIINAVVATLPAAGARELAAQPGVRAVSLERRGQAAGDAATTLSTSFNQSIQAPYLWNTYGGTGRGVGVAVIDTGIAGDLPDFRISNSDKRSRVIGSAVVNPDATTATDRYGHGTHVAGIIAGDSDGRALGDSKKGRFSGVAPRANLVSIKVSDDDGNTSVLDVIAGIQFAMDHKAEYNIRVINLSLESTVAESYKTDPLDAAVEAAWFDGIFVVAAAGNRGPGDDAGQLSRPATTPTSSPSAPSTTRAPRRSATTSRRAGRAAARRRTASQARHLRAGRQDRLDARARTARTPTSAPSCVSEDGEYIRAGRHLDGRSDGRRRRRDRVPAHAEPHAGSHQGAPEGLRPPADRHDRRAEPGRRRSPLRHRRRPAREPGPDPERVHRPRHRPHRLHAVELEPVELEHRFRPAAVELEPLELEHGSGRAAGRRLHRHRRPGPVELEPLQLEPLELVDQLDQVTQRMSSRGTAAHSGRRYQE